MYKRFLFFSLITNNTHKYIMIKMNLEIKMKIFLIKIEL